MGSLSQIVPVPLWLSPSAVRMLPAESTKVRPYGVIYKITNLVNGKIYVGKTKRKYPTARWQEHKKCAIEYNGHPRGKTYFYNALRKYGVENFRFEVIDQAFANSELLAKEMYWIATLQSTNRCVGYNSTYGGESGIPTPETLEKMRGRPCRPETRAKISAAQKGKKQPVTEAVLAAWAARKGKTPTPKMAEHFARMRTHPIGLGTKRTEEQRQHMREGICRSWTSERRAKASEKAKIRMAGKPCPYIPTTEERKRLGALQRLRWESMSPEQKTAEKLKMSLARKGKKQKPEAVAKRAASIKAIWTPERRAAWAERMRQSGVVKNIRQAGRAPWSRRFEKEVA